MILDLEKEMKNMTIVHTVRSFIGQVAQFFQQINSKKEKEREEDAGKRGKEGGGAKR